MLHARHTSAVHAELPRFLLWVQVAGVLACLAAVWLVRVWRRG